VATEIAGPELTEIGGCLMDWGLDHAPPSIAFWFAASKGVCDIATGNT